MEPKNSELTQYLQWEKKLLTAYRGLLKGSQEAQSEKLRKLQSHHPAESINIRNRFNGYARKFEKSTGSPRPGAGEQTERLRWMDLSDLFALCQYYNMTPDQLLFGSDGSVSQRVIDIVKDFKDHKDKFSAFIPKIEPLHTLYAEEPVYFRRVLTIFQETLESYLSADAEEECESITVDNLKENLDDINCYAFNLLDIQDRAYHYLGTDRAFYSDTENKVTLLFLEDFEERLKSGHLAFPCPHGKQWKGYIGILTQDYWNWGRIDARCNESISKYNFWNNARVAQYKKLHLPLPEMYSMHFFYLLFRSGVYIYLNRYAKDQDEDDFWDALSYHPEIEDFLLFTFQNTFYNYYGDHFVWFNGLTDTTKRPGDTE